MLLVSPEDDDHCLLVPLGGGRNASRLGINFTKEQENSCGEAVWLQFPKQGDPLYQYPSFPAPQK